MCERGRYTHTHTDRERREKERRKGGRKRETVRARESKNEPASERVCERGGHTVTETRQMLHTDT